MQGSRPFAVIPHSCLSSETSLAPGLKKSFELVKDEDGKIYLNHPEGAKLSYVGMFTVQQEKRSNVIVIDQIITHHNNTKSKSIMEY